MAAPCQGSKKSGFVYRCNKCGSVGCDVNGCSNQNFANSRCKKCGKLADKTPV